MSGGFLRLFHWRGAPVLAHWSLLLLFASGLRSSHRMASLFALAVTVLVHELGHAILVRRYRLEVVAIQLHAFGGECVHEATRSMRQQVVIAWGGALAQLVLFVAASVVAALPVPFSPELRAMLATWTGSNLAMAAFNLLPIPPLDGARAWRLKHLLPRRTARPERHFEGKRVGTLVDDALERARQDSLRDARSKSNGDRN